MTAQEELIYLACPYTHPSQEIVDYRVKAVTEVAAMLMKAGHLVFSPITHTHPIALVGDLPTDWAFWERYDKAMLAACTVMYILTLPGWDVSKGVAGEFEIATRQLGIPVYLVDQNGKRIQRLETFPA